MVRIRGPVTHACGPRYFCTDAANNVPAWIQRERHQMRLARPVPLLLSCSNDYYQGVAILNSPALTKRGAVQVQTPVRGDKSVAITDKRSKSADQSRDLPSRLSQDLASQRRAVCPLKSTMKRADAPGSRKDKHALSRHQEHRLDVTCKKTRAQQSSPVLAR